MSPEPESPLSAGNHEHIEIVKRVFAAFAVRDLELALPDMAADVKLFLITSELTRQGAPYVGHDGVREYALEVESLWQDVELVPMEFEAVGDAVVTIGEVRVKGPGGEFRQPVVWTWRLRRGLISEVRVHADVAAAREALGRATTAP
jgi:ketosteroid isomerase-like protein